MSKNPPPPSLFLNDIGIWNAYASAGLSPEFCFESFDDKESCSFREFKEWLEDEGIKFLPPGKQRRSLKAKQLKTFHFRGRRHTITELSVGFGNGISPHTLRSRINSGMSVEKAVTSPVMSRSEYSSLGAKAANLKR